MNIRQKILPKRNIFWHGIAMTKYILPAAIALALPILAAYLGVTKALGAHIWWDVKTILIGAPIGILLAAAFNLLSVPKIQRATAFLLLALAAYALAKYGQTAFANSYAEDQLAGKFWYFGWIATGAFPAATLFTTLCLAQPPQTKD